MELPRAVRLALWVPEVTDGADAPRAAHAVTGHDEPHTLDGVPLGRALPALAGAVRPGEIGAVLPAPGDVLGVPAAASALAIEAGECVVLRGRALTCVLVPEVTAFGSAIEPGAHVDWRTVPLGPHDPVPPAPWSLGEARADLLAAMRTATATLAQIDVARWRDEAADLVAEAGSPHPPAGWDLPPDLDPRRVEVLLRAARLLAIADVASVDDGASVTSWQATQRLDALREVRSAARRALCAATTQRLRAGG